MAVRPSAAVPVLLLAASVLAGCTGGPALTPCLDLASVRFALPASDVPPQVHDDGRGGFLVLAMAGTDVRVHALDGAGRQRWQSTAVTTDGRAPPALTVLGDQVLVAGGTLDAVHATRATALLRLDDGTPVAQGFPLGTVFFTGLGSPDVRVVSVRMQEGGSFRAERLLPDGRLGSIGPASPAYIYRVAGTADLEVLSYGGQVPAFVAAYRAATGEEAWRHGLADGEAVAGAAGDVVLVQRGSRLTALAVGDGTTLWEVEGRGETWMDHFGDGILGLLPDKSFVFRGRDGAVQWTRPAPGPGFWLMDVQAVPDGILLAHGLPVDGQGEEGQAGDAVQLMLVDPATGGDRWSAPAHAQGFPAIDPAGRVAFAAKAEGQDAVVALRPDGSPALRCGGASGPEWLADGRGLRLVVGRELAVVPVPA